MKILKILKVFIYNYSIIAIILMTLAILSPTGIIYYENNIYIKIIETLMSAITITYLLSSILLKVEHIKEVSKI
ncbi:MAG: hypothetical protein J5U17_04840 [Candidatus Methanoperedens sp.]|nr:hypothetical protein [Candidatus Methanoperedens sp.]MCE8427739.1 hypothetical protein [Candidatus Methanoperedens sp.]